MAGIQIGIASETKAFKQGVETGIIKPLDKAVDALDDLGKSRGPDQLEDGLKDAQKASERLQDETKDTARTIEKEYRDSYRKLKDSADDGYSGVKEGARSAKEEVIQNFSEVASSFDGSAQGIADGIQGTFGGLASSLPLPLGLAAGAIGVIGGTIASDWAANTEKMKEDANEWAQTFIENGGKVLTAGTIAAKGLDILQNQFEEVTKNATAWGVSQETAAAAMAGSQTALDQVTKSVGGLKDKYDEILRTEDPFDKFGNANGPLAAAEQAWRNAKGSLDVVTGAMDLGAKQADIYSYFLRDLATNTEGATTAVDEFGDSVITLPDGKQIYIDAETGQATDNVDAIEKRIYGMPSTKNVTVTVDYRGFDEAERKLANLARDRTVVVGTRIGNQVW